MKAIARFTITLGLLFTSMAHAQHSEAVADAKTAAIAWLKQVDSADYPGSWHQSAQLFRHAITQASWENVIQAVRTPLGTVQSRQLTSAQFTHVLPDAPDGEYVILQFTTRFTNEAETVETITPVKEQDGQWRVAGYFIR